MMLRTAKDFQSMTKVIVEAAQRNRTRLLSWCLMGNHWHFVVWPRDDGELTAFFRWMTHTHAMRWRVAHRTVGKGPLYQGRFKSFPIQRDDHFLRVCRYVERKAKSAGLVERAEDWRWSSLWSRGHVNDEARAVLSDWPVVRPKDWIDRVNEALTPKELERLHVSRDRGRPYGDEAWAARTVAALGLEHTVRREGRPPRGARTMAGG